MILQWFVSENNVKSLFDGFVFNDTRNSVFLDVVIREKILYPEIFSRRFSTDGSRSLLISIVIFFCGCVWAFTWSGKEHNAHRKHTMSSFQIFLIPLILITQFEYVYIPNAYERIFWIPLLRIIF